MRVGVTPTLRRVILRLYKETCYMEIEHKLGEVMERAGREEGGRESGGGREWMRIFDSVACPALSSKQGGLAPEWTQNRRKIAVASITFCSQASLRLEPVAKVSVILMLKGSHSPYIKFLKHSVTSSCPRAKKAAICSNIVRKTGHPGPMERENGVPTEGPSKGFARLLLTLLNFGLMSHLQYQMSTREVPPLNIKW